MVGAREGQVGLGDGRRLAFSEWGDLDGPLVVLCHGGQMAGIMPVGWDVAESLGIHVVCPDRPGLGDSDPSPDRSIIGWAADVQVLADRLGARRFHVVGVSAGTPYALACGLALSEVDSVGIIAGVVPPHMYVDDGLAALAGTDPVTARRVIDDHVATVALDIEGSVRALAERPPPDGPLYARHDVRTALTAARRRAYRAGTDGVALDILLVNRPWGFDPADIERSVLWWHGEKDSVTPVGLVRETTATMGSCITEVVPGVGHGVSITHTEPFLAEVIGRSGD